MEIMLDKIIGERFVNLFLEYLLFYLREMLFDGRELDYKLNIYRFFMEIIEVGSDKSMLFSSSYLELFAFYILLRYCVIINMDGIVFVERISSDVEIYVDGRRIYELIKLNYGSVIKFGKFYIFKFCDLVYEGKVK